MAGDKWLLFLSLVSFNLCASVVSSTAQLKSLNRAEINLVETKGPIGSIDLSYKKCAMNGTCKIIKPIYTIPSQVLSTWNGGVQMRNGVRKSRERRMIFLPDERRPVFRQVKWARYYPFNSAVAVEIKENTGDVKRCSGVALSTTMFLTAAHCVFTRSGLLNEDVRVGVLEKEGSMDWAQVINVNYHVNCTTSKKGGINRLLDYALLKTTKPLKVERMKIAFLSIIRNGRKNKYRYKRLVSISAYDDQDPTVLRYRSCRMVKASKKRIYSKCDTVPETAGAGVYIVPRWGDRKVIAIASGDYGAGPKRKFSKALRITHMMFVQLCHWLTGGFEKCGGFEI